MKASPAVLWTWIGVSVIYIFLSNLYLNEVFVAFTVFMFSWLMFGIFSLIYEQQPLSRYFLFVGVVFFLAFIYLLYPNINFTAAYISIFVILGMIAIYRTIFSKDIEAYRRAKSLNKKITKILNKKQFKQEDLLKFLDNIRESIGIKRISVFTEDGLLIASSGEGEIDFNIVDVIKKIKKKYKDINNIILKNDYYGYLYINKVGKSNIFVFIESQKNFHNFSEISCTISKILEKILGVG